VRGQWARLSSVSVGDFQFSPQLDMRGSVAMSVLGMANESFEPCIREYKCQVKVTKRTVQYMYMDA
jgi:hypothetical protein